jgi:hypothetical protein
METIAGQVDGAGRQYGEIGSGSSSSSGSSSGDEQVESLHDSGAFPSAQGTLGSGAAVPVVPDPWRHEDLTNWTSREIVGPDQPPTAAQTYAEAQQAAAFRAADGDEILPRQQAHLLEKWMTKRRAIRQQQQLQKQPQPDPRTGGFLPAAAPQFHPSTAVDPQHHPPQQQQHFPVDVDTGFEVLHKYDEKGQAMQTEVLHIPTATATIVEDAMTVTSRPGSIASYPSAATSATPIVSNKTYRAARHPSLASTLPPAMESPESGETHATTSGSGCKQCRAFLDWRTYHGKLAFLLLIILVLAVTTMVVSALLARQSRSIINDSNNNNNVLTRMPSSPTASPSLRPSSTNAPVGVNDSPVAPTLAPSGSTRVPIATPTQAPTVAPITAEPTSTPSLAPSTAAPSLVALEDLLVVEGDAVEGPAVNAGFGSTVALSGDGRVLVVGSPEYERRFGRVEIYALQVVADDPVPLQWVERDILIGTTNQGTLGAAVAVSRDGTIIAVSEPGVERRAGRVVVFAYNPGSETYEQLGNEILGTGPASYSGTALSLSANGLRVAVGAPYYNMVNNLPLHGQVVVYELVGSEWTVMGEPISGGAPLDWLGSAVDLSDDGERLVSSAPKNSNVGGYVGTWQWNAGTQQWDTWGENLIFNDYVPALSSDRFGHSIALSTTRDGVYRLAVGIPWKSVQGFVNAGMTVVLEMQNDRWVQLGDPIVQETPEANIEEGNAVDLLEGSILLVGSPGARQRAGSVRLYRYHEDDGVWEAHPVPLVGATPGDDFGVALAGQREVEINNQGMSFVVGAIAQNGGGRGYVQSYLEQTEPS